MLIVSQGLLLLQRMVRVERLSGGTIHLAATLERIKIRDGLTLLASRNVLLLVDDWLELTEA